MSFVIADKTIASVPANKTIDITSVTPTELVVIAQPQASVVAGAGFGFTVAVEDSQGDVATAYSGSVTVSLGSNPGSTPWAARSSVRSATAWPRFPD